MFNLAVNNSFKTNGLAWLTYLLVSDIEPCPLDNSYYARHRHYGDIMLVFIGSDETCTSTFVSEFAKIYSLPTEKYKDVDYSQFERYFSWLKWRNFLIKGFTKLEDNNYYMVTRRRFYHCYSRYGFCSACGILRCSPVWCICGHKELISGWTSNNKQLDDFIKKTQLEADSPKDQYVEWIPFDFVSVGNTGIGFHLCGLPVTDCKKLIPLEITDKTDVSYYDKVTVEYIYILCLFHWLDKY